MEKNMPKNFLVLMAMNEELKECMQQMLIHITNKFQQELHAPMATAFPVANGGYLTWYTNLFRANRAQYILTTHAASLYSEVLPGRVITDGATYLQVLWHALEQQLMLDGLQTIYERHLSTYTNNVVFVKTTHRSVLGSMNNMVEMLTQRLEWIPPYTALPQLGAEMNTCPFKTNNYQYPKNAFAQISIDEETSI